jgi:hypothetical protein
MAGIVEAAKEWLYALNSAEVWISRVEHRVKRLSGVEKPAGAAGIAVS